MKVFKLDSAAPRGVSLSLAACQGHIHHFSSLFPGFCCFPCPNHKHISAIYRFIANLLPHTAETWILKIFDGIIGIQPGCGILKVGINIDHSAKEIEVLITSREQNGTVKVFCEGIVRAASGQPGSHGRGFHFPFAPKKCILPTILTA